MGALENLGLRQGKDCFLQPGFLLGTKVATTSLIGDISGTGDETAFGINTESLFLLG